ncbi:MAG: addiction module protein [Leptospiraceae bacterium]|nr:addiction module protein [Leptospiraceae bacterium]
METLKQISRQALSLNGLQRAKLAEMLVESLDMKTLSTIDKSWIRIAEKRSAELASGKVKGIEGKKALRHARKKLK